MRRQSTSDDPGRKRQRESIRQLASDIRLSVSYIEDSERKKRAIDWLRRVDQLPETDVLDYVEGQLADLQTRDPDDDDEDGHVSQYEMRRPYDRENGKEEFPDSCEGCQHYGSMCPVFVDVTEANERERMQEELVNEPPSKVKQAYRRFANHNNCHQIIEFVQEWDDKYRGLASEGWDIYEEIEVDVGDTDLESEAAEAAERARADGGLE